MSVTKPTVGQSRGTWGTILNAALDDLDTRKLDVGGYGLVPDSVADQTSALQSFFTDMASRGGTWILPPGTYLVTSTITFNPSVTAVLYAHGATIKASTFTVGAIPVVSVNGSNAVINGLTIDGNSICDRLLTVRDHAQNITFRDCVFKNAAQQPTETDLNVVGLRLEGDIRNVAVETCRFENITAGGGGLASFARGILISDPNTAGVTKNVKIRGCTFTDIKFSGSSTDADAICVQDWATNVAVLVESCYFTRIHKRAVKIQSPGVTVRGNTIENTYLGTSGVNTAPDPQVYAAISAYANDVIIEGNNVLGGSWLHGIEVGTSATTTQRVTVRGNRVYSTSGAVITGSAGIRVYGDNTCSEFIIEGNYLGRFAQGVWLSTAGVGIVVSNNQVNLYGLASSSGILIDGQSATQPTRITGVGNSVEGQARYAIETAIVPTDSAWAANMGGRTGFEVISSSAYGFAAGSRRTFAAANAGGGSVSGGLDGPQGSYLPLGGVTARSMKPISAITYSASMTPDAKLADRQTVTVTNGTAFTMNAPTNPPSSTQSQRLTFEFLNSSGGAMGAITWNAIYLLAGLTLTNPANTKRRWITFEWNGTGWVCTAVAGADY